MSATLPRSALRSVDGPSFALEGRRVRLRAIDVGDTEYLRDLALHPEIADRWRFQFGATPAHRFESLLWDGVHMQLLVESRTGCRPIGVAYTYGLDDTSRSAFLGYVADPRVHGRGWHLEAPALFIDFVFAAAPLDRLYGAAIDLTVGGYESALGVLAKTQGRLRDHVFVAGRYRDLIILAIERDEWLRARPPVSVE